MLAQLHIYLRRADTPMNPCLDQFAPRSTGRVQSRDAHNGGRGFPLQGLLSGLVIQTAHYLDHANSQHDE